MQAIRRLTQQLQQELAGNPRKPMDYRNADPAQAFPQALEAMRNPGFLQTARYKEQQTRALREGAHDDIREFTVKVVARACKLGVPLFPHCMVRSYEDQASAYARGVSWTPPTRPYPHRAFAVDIIHGTLGWMDKPLIPHAWEIIGHIGLETARSMGIKITWGGDWNGNGNTADEPKYDPAHFELSKWRDLYAEQFG